MAIKSIEEQLAPYMTESAELRYGFVMPPITASPQEWLEALLDARRRQDRVEHFLSQVLRGKFRGERAKDAADAQAGDVADTHTQRQASSPIRQEFVSAKEKASAANLAAFEERRTARQTAESLSHVREAYEFVNAARWGLEGVRKDIHATLRAIAFEQSLDR